MAEAEPPRGELETRIGPVQFVVTQGDHVYLSNDSRKSPVVVNSVAYHLSAHLYRLPDGSWGDDSGGARAGTFYMTRHEPPGEPASRPAVKKAYAILQEAWTAFAQFNPELLRQGELYHLVDGIERLDAQLLEAQKAMEALAAERQNLVSAAKRLGYHGPMKQDWAP
jgi:hypothetical protein